MELKLIFGKNGELKEEEKTILNKLFQEYSVRIERQLKQIQYLEIYLKEYGKLGKKKKYSIHIRVISPMFFESEASDWDFARTLHKAFNKLMNEIEHKLHKLNQGSGFRKPQTRRKRGE